MCNGRGAIMAAHHPVIQKRQELIRSLVASGYSYRQVLKLVGLKSTRSVSQAVHAKP
jgi:hypothetical protein